MPAGERVTPTRPSSVGARVVPWGVAGALGAVALARLWRSETVPVLIGVQGVAVWLLLPAHPLAVHAIRRGRVPLAVVGCGLAVVQLALLAGAVGCKGSQPATEGDVRLRIVTANVLLDNPDIRRLGDELAATGADVVLLQEVTPDVLAQLRTSALWTAYPHRTEAPLPRYHGAVTFSALPIVEGRTVDVAGSPMLLTDLQTGAGRLRVVNVHTVAPLTAADARTWRDQLAHLSRAVSSSPWPVVLAGDFNATTDHAPMDRLVGGEVLDAFEVAGTGLGTTWPRWSRALPPVMRLDHVLVGDGVHVVSVTEQDSLGSDHRRLVVELGLRPRWRAAQSSGS